MGKAREEKLFSHTDPEFRCAMSGPLGGKSVTVQPNMSIRGWPTDAGSLALENFKAIEDATVIRRIRDAGGAIRGATRMSEFGFGLRGDTAGEALSQGHADIALVTDTLGEARVAASLAGTCGYKPSWGIVPRSGLIGLVPSMECFGLMADGISDIAAVMAVICAPDDLDFSMPRDEKVDFSWESGKHELPGTVGVVSECLNGLDAEEETVFRMAISRLEGIGIAVREVSLADYALCRMAHNIIGSVEASSSCGKYDSVRYGHRAPGARNWNQMYIRSRGESFGTEFKAYLFQGAYFQYEKYQSFVDASRIRARILHQTQALFKEVDALVFPTRRQAFDAREAETVNQVYDAFSATILASLVGLPALSMPGWLVMEDDDFGLQLVGPRLSDMLLLASADILKAGPDGGE